MKKITMPKELRVCPHCGHEDLSYYHESIHDGDLYYCPKCYGCVNYNGIKVIPIAGEAYPNRDKVSPTQPSLKE